MGVSGVGKSRMARLLNDVIPGGVRAYSIDEAIWCTPSPLRTDFIKWAEVNRQDIRNLSADNLTPTAQYLGMLGSPVFGGIGRREFDAKMQLHAEAEQQAVRQIHTITKQNGRWVIDLSGSFCEVVATNNLHDELLQEVATHSRVVLIEATTLHLKKLAAEQVARPKPLYYRPDFLDQHLPKLLDLHGTVSIEDIHPAEVSNFLYPLLMKERMVRYRSIVNTMGDRVRVIGMSELRQMDADAIQAWIEA